MAFVELGPVTSRVVQAVSGHVDRMKPRNPHKISFHVGDRFAAPAFDAANDLPISTAPLRAAEQADVDDLHRLRGALYARD